MKERDPFEGGRLSGGPRGLDRAATSSEAWTLFFGGLERLGPMTGAGLGRRGHPKARTWGEVNPSWGHLTPKEGEAIPPPPQGGPSLGNLFSWPPLLGNV